MMTENLIITSRNSQTVTTFILFTQSNVKHNSSVKIFYFLTWYIICKSVFFSTDAWYEGSKKNLSQKKFG